MHAPRRPSPPARPGALLLRLALCCAAWAPADAARSQAPAPFSTLDVALGGAADVGNALFYEAPLFYDYWKPGAGAELSVGTPFYLGDVEVGAGLHRYGSATADVPDFDALRVYAGWGIAFRPETWFGWYNGVRLGVFRMRFDEDTFEGVRNESELFVGFHSRVEVTPVRGWSVFGAVTVQQVYTYIRLRPVYLTGGIRRRLDTPGWLEAVLR